MASNLPSLGAQAAKHIVSQVQSQATRLLSTTPRLAAKVTNITSKVDTTARQVISSNSSIILPSPQGLTRIIPSEVPQGSHGISGLNVETDERQIIVTPKFFRKLNPSERGEGEEERAKITSRLDKSFKLQDKSSISAPQTVSQVPIVGKNAVITLDGVSQNCISEGFDYMQRPLVRSVNDPSRKIRTVTDPKQAKALIPTKAEFHSCTQTMVHGKIYKPNDKFCKLMEHCLTLGIVGTKSAMHYIEWLYKAGHETFVLGGAVRDMSRESAIRTITEEEAEKIVNDVDVACVAGTPTALKMFREIHQGDDRVQVNGFPEFGSIHAKIGGGAGFDWNAMQVGNNSYNVPIKNPDTPDEDPRPLVKFGGVPEENAASIDFRCNCLYYDAINRVIVDPTGYGLEDAIGGYLILTEGNKLLNSPKETLPYKQPDLLQRFWKFRMRGQKSNAYTTLLFLTTAAERWKTVDEVKFFNDIMRMLPVKELDGVIDILKSERINEMLDKLEEVMKQDSKLVGQTPELFKKFIEPNRAKIVDYIINFKKPKLG